jgi:molybdopterin-guanine dinucleotide biosynthesis protein A
MRRTNIIPLQNESRRESLPRLSPEVEAALLAGGASRRMGRDKTSLLLAGRSVIERMIEILAPLFSRLRIIAGDGSRFSALGVPVQPDLRPGCGALSGVHAALATASAEAVFVVACDLPLLHPALIRGLVSRLEGHDAVVPWSDKGPEPLCAVYRRRCHAAAEAALDGGELKMSDFLARLSVRRLQGEDLIRLDPDGLGLFNLNTPEDYQRARKILEPSSD